MQELKGDWTADVNWESLRPLKQALIRVDPFKEGQIKCVVHELLHLTFELEFAKLFNKPLNEALILALEDEIDDFIKDSARRTSMWRKTIDAKLEGSN